MIKTPMIMKKKSTYFLLIIVLCTVAGVASIQNSFKPPTGYTGADGSDCTDCHGGSTVNPAGGSITQSGLPSGSYSPGQTYNFSLTITHSVANRVRWGFSIAARNAANQTIGTFSSTNSNAATNGNELSHFSAVSTGAQSSFTFNNLQWKAPTSPGPNDNIVTFYFAGNAGNGGGSSGDFIYKNTTQTILPITLASFDAKVDKNGVALIWKTSSESNSDYFVVEKSNDQFHFIPAGKVIAAGNSNEGITYTFRDDKVVFYDKSIYYRLTLVDKDGKKKYSKVVDVIVKGNGTYVKNIYPNGITAGNDLHIALVSDKEQMVTIDLFSFSGKKIRSIQKGISEGQTDLLININKFTAPGLYSIVVKTENNTQQIPLMIQ